MPRPFFPVRTVLPKATACVCYHAHALLEQEMVKIISAPHSRSLWQKINQQTPSKQPSLREQAGDREPTKATSPRTGALLYLSVHGQSKVQQSVPTLCPRDQGTGNARVLPGHTGLKPGVAMRLSFDLPMRPGLKATISTALRTGSKCKASFFCLALGEGPSCVTRPSCDLPFHPPDTLEPWAC